MPYPLEEPYGEDWEAVRRNFRNLGKDMNPPVPQARVYNDAAIALTTGNETTLTFNSERFDNGNLHSTSSNTGRLTAPVTGLYSFGAHVLFASNSTGYRYVNLRVNGSVVVGWDIRPAVNGDATGMSPAAVYQLEAGDYVEVRAYQTSGGNLNVLSSANGSPEFWMFRVSGFVNQGV